MDNILKKKKLNKESIKPLSEIQKETLIGSTLGDLNLNTTKRIKKPDLGNCRLRFEMTSKNQGYATHLYELFKEYINKPPYLKTRINYLGNKVETIRFHTITHVNFEFLKKIFIISGKKSVPKNTIRDLLTARGLAYWFMDDGGKMDYNKKGSKGIVFNTQGFSLEDVQNMSLELNCKFGLESYIGTNKNRPVIKIPARNYKLFYGLIRPYILDSMNYKLPKNYEITN